MPTTAPSLAGLSRRSVLGAAAGLAGASALGVHRALEHAQVAAFFPAQGPAQTAARLALDGWRAARPGTRFVEFPVTSATRMLSDAAATRADTAVSLLGPRHVALLAGALGRRPLVALGAGERLESHRDTPPQVRWVELNLWQAVEQAGTWAAGTLGPRAVVVGLGGELATDLPFAFRAGLERAGGHVAATQVASRPEELDKLLSQAAALRPDVVLLLASGDAGARALQAARAAGLTGRVLGTGFLAEPALLSRVGADAAGLHVVSTWHGAEGAPRSGYVMLGAQAATGAAPLDARVGTVSRQGRVEPLTVLGPAQGSTSHLNFAWASRTGSLGPFAGC